MDIDPLKQRVSEIRKEVNLTKTKLLGIKQKLKNLDSFLEHYMTFHAAEPLIDREINRWTLNRYELRKEFDEHLAKLNTSEKKLTEESKILEIIIAAMKRMKLGCVEFATDGESQSQFFLMERLKYIRRRFIQDADKSYAATDVVQNGDLLEFEIGDLVKVIYHKRVMQLFYCTQKNSPYALGIAMEEKTSSYHEFLQSPAVEAFVECIKCLCPSRGTSAEPVKT